MVVLHENIEPVRTGYFWYNVPVVHDSKTIRNKFVEYLNKVKLKIQRNCDTSEEGRNE